MDYKYRPFLYLNTSSDPSVNISHLGIVTVIQLFSWAHAVAYVNIYDFPQPLGPHNNNPELAPLNLESDTLLMSSGLHR
jgi:hypothetical protein